jgi:hypothetical protein
VIAARRAVATVRRAHSGSFAAAAIDPNVWAVNGFAHEPR